MKTTHTKNLIAVALVGALAFTTTIAHAADPLPSWNDTAPKKAIVAFVEKVTKEGSPDFVPVPERIATFDNDGTRRRSRRSIPNGRRRNRSPPSSRAI